MIKRVKSWMQKKKPDYDKTNLVEHEMLALAIKQVNTRLSEEIAELYTIMGDRVEKQIAIERARIKRLEKEERKEEKDRWKNLMAQAGVQYGDMGG